MVLEQNAKLFECRLQRHSRSANDRFADLAAALLIPSHRVGGFDGFDIEGRESLSRAGHVF